jgi:leader peptidase (prepilin peptidase)/N-methyltransferase
LSSGVILPMMLGLVGSVIGSFIGLLTLRLPSGAPVAWSRSRCSACYRTLSATDLVPLLSFALLRGQCRTCASSIDRRYPLVELAGLAIGICSALVFRDEQAFAAAVLGWWLLLLGLLDLEHFWLPDRLTYPLAVLGLGSAAYLGQPAPGAAAIGACAGFLVFAAIASAYRRLRGREGLGGGDSKLFAAAGAWVGWAALPLVLLVAAAGGLVAALLLHSRKPDMLVQRLPFGVFLAPAIWTVYLAQFGR